MKKKDFPPKPPSAMHTTPAFLSPQTPPETIQNVIELLERAQKDTYMVKSTEAHHVLWGAIDEAIGILKEAIK